MKIGWFTPFNPRSAIGDYSEAAVTALAATGDDVTVFASDEPDPRRCALPMVRFAPHLTPDFLGRLADFHLLVFNMGDYTLYHRAVYEIASCRPGLVVLHDVVMRNFFESYYLRHRDEPDEFSRLMAYAHGERGAEDARGVRAGQRPDAVADPTRLERPLFLPALRRCLGVVVHSDYALERVREAAPAPATKVDFPLFGPTARLAARPPAAHAESDRVRLLTVGLVNRNKMIHATIRAIADSDLLRKRVTYTVIGEPSDAGYFEDLRGLVRMAGLGDVVELAGWASDDRLTQALLGADVVINLRNPHFGESSASLLLSLVAGVATVLWDHGYYAEFPDDVVCKVSAEGQLTPLLERLARDTGWRRRLGQTARAHALERFDTRRYCERFRAFAEEVLRRKPLLRLADHVSDRLIEQGVKPIDGLAERMAAELAFFAPQEDSAVTPVPLIPRALAG
jgi:glycosyltransferase involved in cell wall biosynthesis